MNFDTEAKSDKKKFGEGGGGRGGGALKPKQQTVSNEVNTKMQLSIDQILFTVVSMYF